MTIGTIVPTDSLQVAGTSRGGYAAMLTKSLLKMKPGQSLKIEVDPGETTDMSAAEAEEWANEKGIKPRPGEELGAAISRYCAKRQINRIMASLDRGEWVHYYRAVLLAPSDEGMYEHIAIQCLDADQRPAPRRRSKK